MDVRRLQKNTEKKVHLNIIKDEVYIFFLKEEEKKEEKDMLVFGVVYTHVAALNNDIQIQHIDNNFYYSPEPHYQRW